MDFSGALAVKDTGTCEPKSRNGLVGVMKPVCTCPCIRSWSALEWNLWEVSYGSYISPGVFFRRTSSRTPFTDASDPSPRHCCPGSREPSLWASRVGSFGACTWKVLISGVISRVTIAITQIRGLITPLIPTHELPSSQGLSGVQEVWSISPCDLLTS